MGSDVEESEAEDAQSQASEEAPASEPKPVKRPLWPPFPVQGERGACLAWPSASVIRGRVNVVCAAQRAQTPAHCFLPWMRQLPRMRTGGLGPSIERSYCAMRCRSGPPLLERIPPFRTGFCQIVITWLKAPNHCPSFSQVIARRRGAPSSKPTSMMKLEPYLRNF